MKLNAVAVSSKDLNTTVTFYRLLGFTFEEFKADEQHVESTNEGGVKLMIDSHDLMVTLIGEEPKPGNHSAFAVQYDSVTEVDETVKKVASAGFTVVKPAWDAFWGQRYAVVEDPDGYKIDLYAQL